MFLSVTDHWIVTVMFFLVVGGILQARNGSSASLPHTTEELRVGTLVNFM